MLDNANKMYFCYYLRIKQKLHSTALKIMLFSTYGTMNTFVFLF